MRSLRHSDSTSFSLVAFDCPALFSAMILAFSFSASNVSGVNDFAETSSGIPLEPVYGPGDRAAEPPAPGSFPFTRGNFPNGYRGRLWTFRQYSGFGTAEESNRRYRYLLEQGGTGLSVALDLRPSAATTPTTPRSVRRWAASASPSTPSPMRKCCSTASHSTRSARASPSTAPPRSCSPSTSPPRRRRGCRAKSSPAPSRTTSSRSTPPAARGSGHPNRRSVSSPTPSSSAPRKCRASTRSRWPAPTSAMPARTLCRRWHSPSPTVLPTATRWSSADG